MTITSLAAELVLILTSYLSRQDCKNLRLSCKQLSQYVAVGLLRSIIVDVKRQNHAAAADQLRSLARQQAPVEVVQKLIIKSLSPHNDPDARRSAQKSPRYATHPSIRVSESDLGVTEEVIYRFLKDALTSLQNVHTVVWNPQKGDPLLTHQMVLSALCHFSQLRHIEVNVTHCKIPLDLCAFQGLESIRYKGISQGFYEDNMNSVSRALFQLPLLKSLDMECATHPTKPALEIQNAHHLFSSITSKNHLPRLRHLGLWFYLIRLDSTTLPYFSSLTSLELRNTNDPKLISSSFRPNPQEPLSYNSQLDDVWQALRYPRVHLENISIDSVVPAFLDYLESYTGLRSLILAPRASKTEEEDRLASRFFQAPLSVHATTLKHLAIKAVEEGPWCFSDKNRSHIAQCQNLISLHMAVETSPILSLQFSLQRDTNIAHFFISLALDFLPRLSTIYIKAAIPSELRGGRRIATIEQHLSTAEEFIMRSIKDYILPQSASRAPMMCVCINQGHDKSASAKERWFETRPTFQNTRRYIECEGLD